MISCGTRFGNPHAQAEIPPPQVRAAGTRAAQFRARLIALLVLVLAAGTLSWPSADAADSADADRRPPGPAVTVGTATGSYRPGLTEAGLVSLTALGEARLWLGLVDKRDKGARFDVQVELLNNGTPVATGTRRCVGDLSPDADRAREIAFPWDEFAVPVLKAGDVLALRVSARIGTGEDGRKCKGADTASGLRLYHDSPNRASGLSATITPDPAVDLFLQSDGTPCRTWPGAHRHSLTETRPTDRWAACKDSGDLRFSRGNAWSQVGTWDLPAQCACAEQLLPDVRNNPPAPKPENIEVTELPLPPVTADNAPGGCTPALNPRGTGCMSQRGGLESGGFLPDGKHVTAVVTFTGAPAAPDPASIYTGDQLIIVKTDGTTFPGGDAWKCVTCGVPPENAQGVTAAPEHPFPLADGKRVTVGTEIVDCGPHQIADAACTPDQVHIVPIRWNTTPDGSGPGGPIREPRMHPDGVHYGFNAFTSINGKLGQYAYIGRLVYNPAPTTGTPLAPRYDLVNVVRLFDPDPAQQLWRVNPDNPNELDYNPDAITVGELRGFSADGREVFYIGAPLESSNIDVFAADLTTGKVRRLTGNPEYVDPVTASPDDRWIVALDTRGSDRQMFLAGMRAVPPVTDMVSTSVTSSTRNNGSRRFFQPILIDRYGDRGSYQGQQLNAAGDGSPGAVNDPNWNGRADAMWSPDGTAVVYWQALVTSPACGGNNPLPCPVSTADGGRDSRMMIARLTDRKPVPPRPVTPIADTVPWGVPYEVGTPPPARPYIPQGTYTLKGDKFGSAQVTITENAARTAISTVAVSYTNYSDDGYHVLNGTESVTTNNPSPTLNKIDWYSDLVQTGCVDATKKTSPDGFHLTIDVLRNQFNATGTLTTTVDGHTYTQPANGT